MAAGATQLQKRACRDYSLIYVRLVGHIFGDASLLEVILAWNGVAHVLREPRIHYTYSWCTS